MYHEAELLVQENNQEYRICVENGYHIRQYLKDLGFKFNAQEKTWCIQSNLMPRDSVDFFKKLFDRGVSLTIDTPTIYENYFGAKDRIFMDIFDTGLVVEKLDNNIIAVLETPEYYIAKAEELEGIPPEKRDIYDNMYIAAYKKRAEIVSDLVEKIKGYEKYFANIIAKMVKRASLITIGRDEKGFFVKAAGGLNPEEWDYVYGIIRFDKDGKITEMEIDKRVFKYSHKIEDVGARLIYLKPLSVESVKSDAILKTPIPILRRIINIISSDYYYFFPELYGLAYKKPENEKYLIKTALVASEINGKIYATSINPTLLKYIDYLYQSQVKKGDKYAIYDTAKKVGETLEKLFAKIENDIFKSLGLENVFKFFDENGFLFTKYENRFIEDMRKYFEKLYSDVSFVLGDLIRVDGMDVNLFDIFNNLDSEEYYKAIEWVIDKIMQYTRPETIKELEVFENDLRKRNMISF